MKIAVGCDNIAIDLKTELNKYIVSMGHSIIDCGCYSADPVDYPDVATVVTDAILKGTVDRGILLCGTGIGMAMAANKVKGIRAAQCYDEYSAERAALSNDSHIITIGSKTTGPETTKRIVKTWLENTFSGGPSAKKIAKIMEIENNTNSGSGAV
jgi:ribose 5-phosphate isomerase B